MEKQNYQRQVSSQYNLHHETKAKVQVKNQKGESLFETPLLLAFIFIILTSFIKIDQNLNLIEKSSLKGFKNDWNKLEKEYAKAR